MILIQKVILLQLQKLRRVEDLIQMFLREVRTIVVELQLLVPMVH